MTSLGAKGEAELESTTEHSAAPSVTGTLIADRYELLAELGSGGAGKVYRVRDRKNGEKLALKALRSDKPDPRLLALFRHEYHTLVQLAHPRIVSVYDFGVGEHGPYYTMELIDGLDVREAAPLPAVEVCRLLRDVASALALLHARRLLHRDVSYRNVRCTSSGHAKLIDFGAMTPIGVKSAVLGTPPFVPPEILSGTALDPRSDLYSLGALAYWLLTARHAYPGNGLPRLRQLWAGSPPPAPSLVSSDVPQELDRLIMSLLSRDPADRPGSAAEVMDRLGAIAELPPAEDLRVAEAYLARPALVGRKRELGQIRTHFKQPLARSLVIEGSEGLGKTRLLEELVIEAKLAGALTLSAAGDAGVCRRYAVAGKLIDALISNADGIGELPAEDRALLALEFPVFAAGPALPSTLLPSELRHRVQTALASWFCTRTRGSRLVIAIDDFHLVDDESAALVATLAANGAESNISVAVSLPAEATSETSAVRLLRKFSSTLRLSKLSERDVTRLIDSVFGDVPNSARVAHWMYARTHGNPLECMELAHYLVERELVQYVEGTWMLPSSLPREVPHGLAATRRARIAALTSAQRSVAEAIAIFGAPVPPDLCAALAGSDDAAAFGALDALVRLELLTSLDGDYLFRAESLRQAIESDITPERARELHERAGQLLAERAAIDLRTRVRSAHHLLRGSSQEEGADAIAAIARDPSVGRDVGEFFTAPLELALRIYEQRARPPADTAPLRARLLNAAFLYDRSLVHHADALLPQLKRDAGLDLLQPGYAARSDWFANMVERATARHAGAPEASRGLPPHDALGMLSAMSGVTLAAAILKWDIPRISQLWDCVRPLAELGSDNPLTTAPELVGLALEGLCVGEASNHEARSAYVDRLRDQAHYPGVIEARRQSILSTQLHNIGMASSMIDGETAMRLADEIDGFGLQMYQGAALQVRLMVYMYRGELARARDCRARLDVLALQGGAGTQFELWLAPYLADPYALWDDVIGLKQSAAYLKRLSESDAGYAPMALIASGHYDRVRRAYPRALEAFERARALAPRDEHASWLLALSGHMDTLVEAGVFDSARAIGHELLASLDYRAYFSRIVEQRVACTLALAEAQCGEMEQALARTARAIERERALGRSPLQLGRLHEVEARLAILRRDGESFARQLEQVHAHFGGTRNPALMTRYRRLAEDGRTLFSPPKPGTIDSESDPQVKLALTALAQLTHSQQRAQHALELVTREVFADTGFLYLMRGEQLELVAGAPGHAAPDTLHGVLSTLMHEIAREVDTTTELTATASKHGTSMSASFSCADREFVPIPLRVDIDGVKAVVGVVAIRTDPQGALAAPPTRLLDAIARALYDAGDIVLPQR